MKKMTKRTTILLILFAFSVFAGLPVDKAAVFAASDTVLTAHITAPEGASVQVFRQIANFNTVGQNPVSSLSSNGKRTYSFELPKRGAGFTYRVSMAGKITKAGFLDLTSEASATIDISFEQSENPQIRPDYLSGSMANKNFISDGMYLNINPENALYLSVGDTFTVRALRIWEIVNTLTSNIMIEPNFHFEILSGDCISLLQHTNKAEITALHEGTAVVEVTYDAIEIGGNTPFGGIYGASDPVRSGLFVVSVGEQADIDLNLGTFDSDFDTVYFTGSNGEFTFSPKSDSAISVSVNGEPVEPSAGAYAVPVSEGNNIVKASVGDRNKYFVVKGKKITPVIENLTNPDTPLKCGDTVRITFKGLLQPVQKLSGIYNPQHGACISYTLPDGSTVTGKPGAQYALANDHAIELTLTNAGNVTLTNGRINLSIWGSSFGAHRYITDSGIPQNIDAPTHTGTFSYLPDITLGVMSSAVSSGKDDGVASFTVFSADGSDFIIKAVYSDGGMTSLSRVPLEAGTKTYNIKLNDGEKLFVWRNSLAPLCEVIEN